MITKKRKLSEETKLKISKSKKGKTPNIDYESKEYRDSISGGLLNSEKFKESRESNRIKHWENKYNTTVTELHDYVKNNPNCSRKDINQEFNIDYKSMTPLLDAFSIALSNDMSGNSLKEDS